LLAHGLGRPVADAVTRVTFPAAGRHRLWVRTRDWVTPWGASGAPGRFQVLLDRREGLGLVRVMRTCGMMGEIVGKAAAICVRAETTPRGVYEHHLEADRSLMPLPGEFRHRRTDG
jgi:hypothetical protein